MGERSHALTDRRGIVDRLTRFATLVCIALLLVVSGCEQRRRGPELLTLTDVVPRMVEVGDHIEVLGVELPANDVQRARVIFEGEIRRPGRPPLKGQRIEVAGATVLADKVSLPYTEALQQRFCGRGDEAISSTFAGTVTVVVPTLHGGVEVFGTVGSQDKDVVLDLTAPRARRVVEVSRDRDAARAHKFLGVTLEPAQDQLLGATVSAVEPDGIVGHVGITPGDVLLSLDGATIRDPRDVIPNGEHRQVELVYKRGNDDPESVTLIVDGFRASAARDLISAVLLLGVLGFAYLFYWLPTGRLLSWLEHRLIARVTARHGGEGPRGFWGWLFSTIRSAMHDDAGRADGLLAQLAPYFVWVAVSATFGALPFGQALVSADLDVGILFLLSVTSLCCIAVITGGPAEQKWSAWAGLKAGFQVLSCEIPAALAITSVVVMTGSLSLADIIAAQSGSGAGLFEQGSFPWFWNAFKSPVTFVLFLLFFVTPLTEGGRSAGVLAGADAQGSQPSKRSTVRFMSFFVAEWTNVFMMAGLASALFLGGWHLPGIDPTVVDERISLQVLGAAWFLIKTWVLIVGVVWLRWSMPRVRVAHLLGACWKWFIPVATLCFGVTVMWARVDFDPSLQLLIGTATFCSFTVIGAGFVFRVRRGLLSGVGSPRLNAFL